MKIQHYLIECPNKPDDKTSIVCFHGRPNVVQAQRESVTTPMATYKPQSWIKDYFLQACAYSKMWEERTGSSIDQLVILIAVDNAEPQVFISDANEWHDELKSIIYENKQRVQQGT